MTGPISFRTPTSSAAPIQRSAPPVTPSPPPPKPARTVEAYRSPAQTASKPIDVKSEAASASATIASSSPEQVEANASRLSGLKLELANKLNALRPASQHQVLTLTEELTDLDDTVSNDQYRSASQSGISSKGKLGSPFGVGIPLKPGATVDVVGHGSSDGKTIGGKTPQQLVNQLKAGGATQLAMLDLKSCHSEAFKAELEHCLKDVGIEVGEIKTYKGNVAVSRATGEVMQGDGVEKMTGHDGLLGELSQKTVGTLTRLYGLKKEEIDTIETNVSEKRENPLHGIDLNGRGAVAKQNMGKAVTLIKQELLTLKAHDFLQASVESGGAALRKDDYKLIGLSGQLCHEYTLGGGAPTSPQDLAKRSGGKVIAVCFKDGAVAHTAKMEIDGKFTQSLLDNTNGSGALFSTSLDTLKKHYNGEVLIHHPKRPIADEAWKKYCP